MSFGSLGKLATLRTNTKRQESIGHNCDAKSGEHRSTMTMVVAVAVATIVAGDLQLLAFLPLLPLHPATYQPYRSWAGIVGHTLSLPAPSSLNGFGV